jgi:hypothetical protein
MTVTFQSQTYTIPTGYNTLSWGKYLEVKDSILQMELIARVLGIPYNDFLKCNDVKGASEVSAMLAFMKEQPVINAKPYLITTDGNVVMTPTTLDKVTFAQYQDMAMIMGKEGMDEFERITYIVAIASMKEYLGVYDSDKLESMMNTVKQCSTQSVIDTYSFFLKNTNGLRNGTHRTSSKLGTLRKRLWQALKSLSGSGS